MMKVCTQILIGDQMTPIKGISTALHACPLDRGEIQSMLGGDEKSSIKGQFSK